MINRLLHILFFTLSIASASAQESQIKILLDTNTIRIGENVNFKVEVTYPVKNKIIFTEPKDTLTGKIEILHKLKTDTAFSDDLLIKTLTYNYSITSFDSGYHVIPPISLISNSDTILSNPLLLTVYTIDVDTTAEIKDIKEIYRYPFSFWDWVIEKKYYILGTLLLLTLVFFAIRYWKKIKPKPEIKVIPEVIIPAHIIALEKLKIINEQKYWQSGEIKTYHSEITDTIRKYIENVFNIDALELTSDEILTSLRLQIADEQTKRKLKQILLLADMVKFAKEKPLPTENEFSMQLAIEFINETSPKDLENKK